MRCPSFPTFARLRRCRGLLKICCPALLTVAAGCGEFRDYQGASVGAMVRGELQTQARYDLPSAGTAVAAQPRVDQPAATVVPAKAVATTPNVQQVAAKIVAPEQPKVEQLPPTLQPRAELPTLPSGARPTMRLGFSNGDPGKIVPVNLDTVLRLAETQNSQTAVAREKLNEAFANQEVAAKAWIPDLWVGANWYRHDGGSANPDGTLEISNFNSMFAGAELCGRLDLREAVYRKVEAERRTWQQRGEVSKLNAEMLLEASSAYIDLLAARAAEAITTQMETKLQDLLQNATAIAKTIPAAEVEVARVQAEISGMQQIGRKFHEGALAATAKLLYMLGLDPTSEVAVMDRHLIGFSLVNAELPADALVAMALQNGPGIQEVEGLIQLIQQASAKDTPLSQCIPVFDFRVAEGGFGTGPGDQMSWDSRFDLGMQMRWNLTELLTRREKERVTQARVGQVHATYADVRGKLTMGVQESRESVLSGRDQMDFGLKQIKYATDAFERSNSRLMQAPNVKDRSPSEVLLAIRGLTAANLTYLGAIRDHDKAQLRLAILTGTVGSRCH